MRTSIRATAVLAVLCSPVLGQTQIATYELRFANGTSAINLRPGQTTTVDMYVLFVPGVGGTVINPPLSGPAAGLSDGAFNIVGEAPAGVTGSWTITTSTASPVYSLPNPWGGQAIGGVGVNLGFASGFDVAGVYWGYGFLLAAPHPFPQYPPKIWQATFTAGSASAPGDIQLFADPILATGVFAGAPASLPFVAYFEPASAPASITVVCYADCNASGSLTIADFGCFQAAFAAGNMYADCNANGSLTIADFGCFQAAYASSCP